MLIDLSTDHDPFAAKDNDVIAAILTRSVFRGVEGQIEARQDGIEPACRSSKCPLKPDDEPRDRSPFDSHPYRIADPDGSWQGQGERFLMITEGERKFCTACFWGELCL